MKSIKDNVYDLDVQNSKAKTIRHEVDVSEQIKLKKEYLKKALVEKIKKTWHA